MNKNDFAKTPPMGWNSYDYYDTTVTEEQIKANADYMAENLKEYGWEYIVVDIEWYAKDAGTKREQFQYIPFGDLEIDEYGRFLPAVNRFPSAANGAGFKPLADYVHSKGLKFGIHIMRGVPRIAAHLHMPIHGTKGFCNEIANPYSICGWNPDMYGVIENEQGQAYYDSLLSLYAGWGVDFIKCDDICDSWMYGADHFNGWAETRMLHKAISKCERPIVLSLSPGPAHVDKAFHYCTNANMWRITDDFWDNWKSLKDMFRRCEQWQDHVKTGCYPDCDMLPLGKLGKGFGSERECHFTEDEKKTMMTLWCMFRSPLMLGGEMTMLNRDTRQYLCNKKLLSLLGENRKGRQVYRTEKAAVWMNVNESGDDLYLAFFNLSEEDQEITCSFSELEAVGVKKMEQKTMGIEIWNNQKRTAKDEIWSVAVKTHGAVCLQITE